MYFKAVLPRDTLDNFLVLPNSSRRIKILMFFFLNCLVAEIFEKNIANETTQYSDFCIDYSFWC